MQTKLPKIEVEWINRLCEVGDRIGYFHTWEHFSKPIPASPMIGGEPAGVFSKVWGIVEFSDGVERVDPTDICFCDEGNEMLRVMEEHPELAKSMKRRKR